MHEDSKRIDALEIALREGLVIESSDSGWEFSFDDGEVIAANEDFRRCIDIMSDDFTEFENVQIGQEFIYLDQKWEKVSYSEAIRFEDNIKWAFPGDELVAVFI